jgi:uncharacterized delta-60 repeat protein
VPRLLLLIGVVTIAAVLAVAAPAAATPYDNTFSGDGIATFGGLSAGPDESAFAVAVQGDGKTVIAGFAADAGNVGDAMVMRLKQDGTLDETFGNNGRTVVTFVADANDRFNDVEIAPDGKIVATGFANGATNDDFDTIVARFNQDGTLDNDSDADPSAAFSEDGLLTIDLAATRDDVGEAVIVQGSGKPVIASQVRKSATALDYDFGLLRLNQDGTPDGTWGPGGLVTQDIGPGTADRDAPDEMVEQTDDKIVVAGGADMDTTAAFNDDFAFARFNSDGTLDSGVGFDATPADEFGSGGIRTVPLTGNVDFATSVVMLDDGRIVGGGQARPNSASDTDVAVVALTSAGALDTSGFGTNGSRVTDLGSTADRLDGLSVQSDGKIAAAGESAAPAMTLLRYTSAGALDPAFDGDGIFVGPAGQGNDIAAAGGRLTAVGSVTGSDQDVLAIRVHQNDVDSDNATDETDNCVGVQNPDQANNDGDTQGDACDADDDNDGTPDSSDAFPKNGAESADTDGDGIGNNADGDDDNDGTPDGSDAFPLNPAESLDTDRDGIGNNADPDDDNDTFPDAEDGFPLDHNRWNAPDPVGTNGNDTLIGSNISNVICGLFGNDRIDGEGGNDILYGDRCNDKTKVAVGAAQTSDGRDNITGGTGNDRLLGAGGNDKLNGEEGNDKLYGGGGNDKLTGADGNDFLRGDSGRDSYRGGAGNDSISARDGVRESVNCGTGSRDKATVDRNDKVSRNCERVRRPRR